MRKTINLLLAGFLILMVYNVTARARRRSAESHGAQWRQDADDRFGAGREDLFADFLQCEKMKHTNRKHPSLPSPPSGPATGSFNGLQREVNFLAFTRERSNQHYALSLGG